jgi:serine/threonine protein phosphatase PrpC
METIEGKLGFHQQVPRRGQEDDAKEGLSETDGPPSRETSEATTSPPPTATDDDESATTAPPPSRDDCTSEDSSSTGCAEQAAADSKSRSFSDCGLSERAITPQPEVVLSSSCPPPLLRSSKSRMATWASEPSVFGDGRRIGTTGARNTPRDLGGFFAEDWPPQVVNCLEEPEAVVARCLRTLPPPSMQAGGVGVEEASQRSRRSTGLRLMAGVYSLPHPEKAGSTGADSYFIAETGTAVGVADGVGEWEWRFKCNPRAFADELMSGAQAKAEEIAGSEQLNAAEGAVRALRHGFDEARSFGSATALVAMLNSTKGLLGVANLGDSTLIQLRRDRATSPLRFRRVGRTAEQQHAFNCPYQLCSMPTEADFPRLIAEGKQALVRAIQRNSNKQDMPYDADKYILPVLEGDLLILGTDGIFDNLHDREVCQLASQAISPFEAQETLDTKSGRLAGGDIQATAPQRLATAMVEAALHRSKDLATKSPFSMHAQKAGLYHMGGKMDDITCVCAWVVRTTGAGDASG